MGLLTDPGKSDKFAKVLVNHHLKLSAVSFVVGLGWLLCLVDDNFNMKTYFSENALLPGLVLPEFTSSDEAFASKQFRQLTEYSKEDGEYLRSQIKQNFRDVGLEVYDHFYNYSTPRFPNKVRTGHGIYAILRAPRGSSLESIVISSPLRPANTKLLRTEGGIAMMIALAQQFRYKSYWSKDIMFVVTDNEHFGAKAWVEAYHGITSQRAHGSSAQMHGRAGSIQAAINLEIPSPDVDYMDLRIMGINGQLPNLDFVNLLKLLLNKQQIPLTIQGVTSLLDRVPKDFFGKYLRDFQVVFRMIKTSALGDLDGNHGFFQQYNIQALSIRGMKKSDSPGTRGGIGFYRLGIALEGTCRSLNNLLERFHQSFFFYLLTSPSRFVSIGMYMPPLGLLVLPLILKALALWAEGSVSSSSPQTTPATTVGAVLPWLLLAHAIGIATFVGQYFLDLSDLPNSIGTVMGSSNVATFLVPTLVGRFLSKPDADCLKALSLIEMAIGLYALSMLNFPLALLIALFSVPIAVWTSNQQPQAARVVHGILLFVLYPIFPIVVNGLWNKISGKVIEADVAEEIAETSSRSITAVVLTYFEYGNWLDPVIFLFLKPLWILHWMVFWAK